MGGLRNVTGFEDRPPSRIGVSVGDTLAALFATIGCLVAVHERNHSGKGQVVDTALYESVFSIMESLIPDYLLAGYVRERMGNILPGVAPSNIYFTKDRTYIVIGANSDGVFTRLCEAMGNPGLAQDERFSTHYARGENMKLIDSIIEEWTKSMDAQDALEILAEKGVPSGLIYTAKEILEDPHYKEREMILKVDHPDLGEFPMPGIVPKLSRTPGRVKEAGAEKMGKHNMEIYSGMLGMKEEELETLQKENII